MTWTQRMIASLTALAERKWARLHAATSPGARKHWEREYNRTMYAVRWLEGRAQHLQE